MSKGLKISLILLAVAAYAVVAIILPNLRHRADGDHGFDRLQSGACAGELRWSVNSLPVTLVIDPTMDAGWQAVVLSSALAMNQRLGVEAFRTRAGRVEDYETSRLREIWIETTNTSTHGHTAIEVGQVSCRFKQGRIELPGLVRGDEYRQAATRHELGHALGLAHDTVPEDSVMYAKIKQWSRSSQLTEADVARLREAWIRDR